MNFYSIKDFRDRAKDQDYQELENFILAQPKRTEAFPCEQYAFSYTAAAQELRKKGYLGGIQEDHTELKITISKEESINRTFCINKSILERFDKMANDNWLYNKKVIFNQILSEALDRYGY